VRFDNHLTLKHPDSQSFLFRRLKRPKQGIAQEGWGHSASIIRDGKRNPAILGAGLNFDPSALAHRVSRIQEEVRDNAAQLVAIGQEFWQDLKFRGNLDPGRSIDILNRLLHHRN
jgi:hypothetical protein